MSGCATIPSKPACPVPSEEESAAYHQVVLPDPDDVTMDRMLSILFPYNDPASIGDETRMRVVAALGAFAETMTPHTRWVGEVVKTCWPETLKKVRKENR